MVGVLESLNKEEKLVFKLRNLFESYGYEKLGVNLLEEYESYYLHGELLKVESLLKVIDPNGKLYVLRPDMTMPIAKKFARENTEGVMTNKVYYSDDVFRVEGGSIAGIIKQKQMGVEFLGEKSVYADYEVINLAIETLKEISPKYHLDISHSDFLKVVFDKTTLNYEEKEKIIEYLKNRAQTELKSILNKVDVDEKVKNLILDIPNLYGEAEEVLKKIEAYDMPELDTIVEELRELKAILPAANIELDFSMVNNLNYYTGVIFKGYLQGLSQVALQGGRYDNLTEKFGKKMEAIGFAINLEEVFGKLVLEETKTLGDLFIYKEMEGMVEEINKLRKESKRLRIEKYTDRLMEESDKLREKYEKIYLYEDGRAGEM